MTFLDRQIGCLTEQALDVRLVQVPIHLSTRPVHGWTFGSIEHAKLDRRMVSSQAAQTTKRIQFSRQCAFTYAADTWIAAHFANCGGGRRQKNCRGTCPRRGSCCLDTSMSATNDNCVKELVPSVWTT